MTSEDQRAKDLLRTLVPNGFKRDRSDTSAYRYVGNLMAGGRSISVAISFANLEFDKLPQVELLRPEEEAPHVIAHLRMSGGLCFARDEDVVLDRYDVGGTALTCLELARRGLERVLTHKHLEHDIADEFPQHWFGIPFYHDIETEKNALIHLYLVPSLRPSGRYLLTDHDIVLKRLVANTSDRKKVAACSSPAFIFRSPTDLTFNAGQRAPETLAAFLDWLESAIPGSRERAFTEISGGFPQLTPLFVRAPNGCVGIAAEPKPVLLKAAQRRQGMKRLLAANADKISVRRFSGSRFDIDFIFGRNMPDKTSLGGRRLALIGCGTIGSLLAKFLAHSGAGQNDGTLLLLDNQRLEPGNVGRHYLGLDSVGEYKAEALKVALARQFADANILGMSTDALSFLQNLKDYDLVIDATGEEAVSVAVNHHFKLLRARERSPDLLHVRLFGNGAAAQALLVDRSEYACFKCLKPDHAGEWRFNPLKAGVVPTHTTAACGEAQYIAYGIAAPAMAAALALQIALDWNSGDPAPRMRTVRVEKAETREVADKNPERSERCPACGATAKN